MAVLRGYLPELDGIRGIFVLVVMAYHFQTGWFPGGALSVDVFFALSGYLITGLLIRENATSGTIKLKDFYLRRALRLMPALMMLLVVGGAIADLALPGPRLHRLVIGGAIAALYLTDIASYTHSTIWATYVWIWTLAIEEHFYLLWPGLLRRVVKSRRQMYVLVYGLATAALVLGELTAYGGKNGQVPRDYYQPQEHAFCIMLGCAAALTVVPRWFRHLAAPALVTMFVLTIVSPGQSHLVFLRLSIPAEAISTVVLILALEHQPRIALGVLTFAPISRLGVISYSLYLYHPLIYPVLQQWVTSQHVLVPLSYVVSITAAELSYRYYESPIRRLGRDRMASRGSRRADSPATS